MYSADLFLRKNRHRAGTDLEVSEMKVVILAGGLGTRISEESHLKPKPMIEIGERPILWHIMKYYSTYGFDEFIICAGYKQYVIKEYFAEYFLHNSDVTFDLSSNSMTIHNNNSENWKVSVIDTGLMTMTGGRIRRIRKYIGDETFMLTYGDGVCNVDLEALLKFHRAHGRIATITMVNISEMKGVLEVEPDGRITSFREKDERDASLINGAYMVFNPEIFDYLDSDETVLEKGPLSRLSEEGQLMGYNHEGFWQCMDTQREKTKLEALWASGNAPWKRWQEAQI